MTNRVVLDLFLGDSGKGKIVDLLAEKSIAVVRYNGSNNAGHTLKVCGKTFKTHAVPSGVLYAHTTNFIGHGCAINPKVLIKEIEMFKDSKVFISGQAHLILPHHIEIDIDRESRFQIGTTKQGVGPVFEDKVSRRGIRYQDLLLSENELMKKISQQLVERQKLSFSVMNELKTYKEKLSDRIIFDGVEFIHKLKKTGDIVFEGAQGTYLDIDMGNYPFVTSSNTTIGSVFTGTGISPKDIDEVIGIFKAYGSYVGTRTDFPDIEEESLNNKLCELGNEYGTTTGRRRRLCWLDLDLIKKAIMINGCTHLGITRLDTLGQMPIIKVKYNNNLVEFEPWGDLKSISDINILPEKCLTFIRYIEAALEMKISILGVGAERQEVIFNDYQF